MVRSLGASAVVDHASPCVVADVVAAIAGRPPAGTIHATGDIADCLIAVSRCAGMHHVAATLPPPGERPATVKATHIFGTSLKDDDVGPMLYRDFLPGALAGGAYIAAPPARIAGHGLDVLQPALQVLKGGVSGGKVVVSLS